MKYIKQYELFGMGTSKFLKEINKLINHAPVVGNSFLLAIIENDYSNFKKFTEQFDSLTKTKNDLIFLLKTEKNNNENEDRIDYITNLIERITTLLNNIFFETDTYGNTALLVAAKEGRLKMVKELIKIGFDIYHTNNKGETFYDVAINRYKFINNVKDWIEKTYPEIISANKYNL